VRVGRSFGASGIPHRSSSTQLFGASTATANARLTELRRRATYPVRRGRTHPISELCRDGLERRSGGIARPCRAGSRPRAREETDRPGWEHLQGIAWSRTSPLGRVEDGGSGGVRSPAIRCGDWQSAYCARVDQGRQPFLHKHYKASMAWRKLSSTSTNWGEHPEPGGVWVRRHEQSWMKPRVREPLRKLLRRIGVGGIGVDLGPQQGSVPDADGSRILSHASRTRASHRNGPRLCVLPREQTRVTTSPTKSQRKRRGCRVRDSARTREPRTAGRHETDGGKIRAAGVPLREFAGVGPLRGVVTGCNERSWWTLRHGRNSSPRSEQPKRC